ncbi:MAG: class I SAM-dependent methyltransferase [Gemmataceae bacterium]|nr:class I SAM-dependent methyltransferase [Gemmataceae bacterium]
MSGNDVLPDVRDYYARRLREHGATPRGVDWNGAEGQAVRFDQLLAVCREDRAASLGDYGCGYGAMLGHARKMGFTGPFLGYDIAEPMVEAARAAHPDDGVFSAEEGVLDGCDYVVASGIFNVKLQASEADWLAYVEQAIARMARLARKGFAFNALTSYSDEDRKRPDLHYADPCRLFDLCRRRHSRHVALRHDYGLWEFTILVRKEAA